jgi:glyoxylase-like metal-dependent hydrolase (beta-lactamase superfamily II)
MGMSGVQNFAGRSPVIAQVLEGFTAFRPPAEIFEREKVLDLGGVRVRMVWLGPGHTRGDTILFVEVDGVRFSGDLAMTGDRTPSHAVAEVLQRPLDARVAPPRVLCRHPDNE